MLTTPFQVPQTVNVGGDGRFIVQWHPGCYRTLGLTGNAVAKAVAVPLVEAAMRGIVVTTDRYVRAPGRNLPCLYPEAATFYTFDCAHFETESCTYIVALLLLTWESINSSLFHYAIQKARHIAIMCDSSGDQRGSGFTFVVFNPDEPKDLKPRAPSDHAERARRRTITEEERANIRAVKAKGPCLRCKILKNRSVSFIYIYILPSANLSV